MTTYAAEIEARRAKLLALALAATAEGLRLLAIADALRRQAGQLAAFPTSPVGALVGNSPATNPNP